MLGDQKRGTNIEAPADLIRQMVAEGIRAANADSGGNSEAYLVIDEEILGKIVYRLNKSESNRVGVSLEEY